MQKAFFRDPCTADWFQDLCEKFGVKPQSSSTADGILNTFRDYLKKLGSKYYRGSQNRYYHVNNAIYENLRLIDTPSRETSTKIDYRLTPTVNDFLQQIKSRTFGSPTLKYFTYADLNVGIKEILPEVITDTLWPLNVNTGNLNFYNSFCLGYLTCHNGGTLFQRAVAHRAITQPNEFTSICDIFQEHPQHVLESIRYGKSPTQTEIALLSKVVDRNITVFQFNENGQIESDIFYDFNNHGVHTAPTNYLGCIAQGDTKTFFPLVRKQGMTVLPPEAQTSAIVGKAKHSFFPQQESEKNCMIYISNYSFA